MQVAYFQGASLSSQWSHTSEFGYKEAPLQCLVGSYNRQLYESKTFTGRVKYALCDNSTKTNGKAMALGCGTIDRSNGS